MKSIFVVLCALLTIVSGCATQRQPVVLSFSDRVDAALQYDLQYVLPQLLETQHEYSVNVTTFNKTLTRDTNVINAKINGLSDIQDKEERLRSVCCIDVCTLNYGS